jgi:hypothetical protein
MRILGSIVAPSDKAEPSMGKFITDLSSVTTVGLDLAKHVFQVHGVDASWRVIVAKVCRHKDMSAFFAQLPECPRCSGSKAGKKNAKIFWNVVLGIKSLK